MAIKLFLLSAFTLLIMPEAQAKNYCLEYSVERKACRERLAICRFKGKCINWWKAPDEAGVTYQVRCVETISMHRKSRRSFCRKYSVDTEREGSFAFYNYASLSQPGQRINGRYCRGSYGLIMAGRIVRCLDSRDRVVELMDEINHQCPANTPYPVYLVSHNTTVQGRKCKSSYPVGIVVNQTIFQCYENLDQARDDFIEQRRCDLEE